MSCAACLPAQRSQHLGRVAFFSFSSAIDFLCGGALLHHRCRPDPNGAPKVAGTPKRPSLAIDFLVCQRPKYQQHLHHYPVTSSFFKKKVKQISDVSFTAAGFVLLKRRVLCIRLNPHLTPAPRSEFREPTDDEYK